MATPPDPEQISRLQNLFPRLAHFAIRGPATVQYNCVAWALGITTDWWWPGNLSCWPIRQRTARLEGFIAAFAAVGFEECAAPEIEPGYEKIALYTRGGFPMHVARIESALLWSSKIGGAELIEHEPSALDGNEFGLPTHFFRRKSGARAP